MATNGSPNGPVEKKVTMSSVAAMVTSAIVVYILAKVPALQAWNDVVQTVVSAVVVAAITFVVGFWTKHTARNDVGTRRTGTSDPIPPTG
jgi:hypothetical protein